MSTGARLGKKFKVGQLAPEGLRELPKPADENLGMRASPVTFVARAMFAKPKSGKPVKPMKPVVPLEIKKKEEPKEAEKEVETEKEEEVEEKKEAEEEEEVEEEKEAEEENELAKALDGDLKTMGDLILQEEAGDLYNTTVPTAYVPHTRRGFSEFIKSTYATFELPAGPINIPEGERYYPYQKFVRDYMRNEAPYRGILVYHGLGSGKTCTSIAASEALYASAKKKIIVMTPASLRKNFLKEISFCGFRHFQLNNFWVALDPKDATTTLFANQILGLSGAYLRTAKHVWVPDFRKPQAESNYTKLNDLERTEIRKQILSIVEWHPKTNPTGRIRFLNYNGLSTKNLIQMACDPHKFFDNSVIVIDEIHNLTRLMQGMIEPYIIPGGKKRKITIEEITPNRWKPSVCDENTKLYTRGYLFYRLLLDAQNSKIIGLSGTPLINFPEELGILANVLHGYITILEGEIGEVGEEIKKKAEAVGHAHQYTDFVQTKLVTKGGGTHLLLSLLPPGIRKIANDIGVVRIPEEEHIPTIDEVLGSINEAYMSAGIHFTSPLKARSEALLPPFKEEFKNNFLQGTILAPKHKPVLATRLTGLISFYKGSQLEIMPRVKSDEVVRVPFSLYAQKAYSFKRTPEVKTELEAKGEKGIDAVFAKVYELGDSASANNYKMGSRQACNFAFPPDVSRPAASAADRKKEAQEGLAAIELAPIEPEQEVVEDGLDVELEGEDDEVNAEEAVEADEAIIAGMEGDVPAPVPAAAPAPYVKMPVTLGEEVDAAIAEWYASRGEPIPEDEKGVGAKMNAERAAEFAAELVPRDGDGAVSEEKPAFGEPGFWAWARKKRAEKQAARAAAGLPPLPTKRRTLKGGGKTIAELRAEKATTRKGVDCKGGTQPGETYKDACARAKECLKTVAKSKMTLGGADGLANYSAKYAAMLEKIIAAPGSSLVYSQFLDMEGVGLFRVAMEVNGFAPIEIVLGGGTVAFSKATEESLKKKQPRYMTFSGGEKPEVRRAALDIFNAKFAELPESMNKILAEAGYTDNKLGDLCRVFCITSAGAEGLSLRNVRAVHIMEPYWNEVRLRQVKGRAIRIGSHLDLPENQRDVSIYTYISCFSEAAQRERVGDNKIDETLLLHDSVDAKKALEVGIPIKPGMTAYVLTTDEMIYTISERKRKIIEALECILKTAAVDCELSYKQNKDGTFRCLPLKGKVGDFIYHPILADDILEAGKFDGVGDICTGVVKGKELYQKINKVTYRLREILGDDNSVTGFEVFEADQDAPTKKIPENRLGTVGMRMVDGVPKPGPPLAFTPVKPA